MGPVEVLIPRLRSADEFFSVIACSRTGLCPGGFKMSGIGSKAGGPDYLLQFLEPRVVTENTMRRGFIPSED